MEYYVKSLIYNREVFDKLWEKSFHEKLTEEEDRYIRFCYHLEEFEAGIL